MNLFDYLFQNQKQNYMGQSGMPFLGQNGVIWSGPRPGGPTQQDRLEAAKTGGRVQPMKLQMTPWGQMIDQYGNTVTPPADFKPPAQWPNAMGGGGNNATPAQPFAPPSMNPKQAGENGGVARGAAAPQAAPQGNAPPGQGAGDLNGLVSAIMPQPAYSQQAMGQIGGQMGSTMQAAQNILGGMLPEMGQAASNDQQVNGFNFRDANGRSMGTANVGAMPGLNPMGGMGQGSLPNFGIAPQQFWGPQQSQQLAGNFNALRNTVMPTLSGSAGNAFGNFLQGMQGKIGSTLNRQGYQQQAQHNLAAQTAAADATSSGWGQMGKAYGQNLDRKLTQKKLQTQMLGALS